MLSSFQDCQSKPCQLTQRILVFLSKGPAYYITYGRWRLEGWWHKQRKSFRSIDDDTLFTALDLTVQGLDNVERAIKALDTREAKVALSAHFSARSDPKFHFTPEHKERIISTIGYAQKEKTIRAAEEIHQNLFRFRRSAPVEFETTIDWGYSPNGNTDWTWDLNRHTYFITLGKAYWYTGDEKYVAKFAALIEDWIAANPVGVGNRNWDSVLEAAVRLNNWIWGYFFFRQAPTFDPETHITFLKGLLGHAHYLAARIEHHSANNHLLLEAKALAFCGLLFPEFKAARAWTTSGLRILWREIEKQICPDGVHGERTTLYHRRVLSDILEILVLLENHKKTVPEIVIDRFKNMLTFDVNITKPNGALPLFADSALTDEQIRFSNRGNGAVLFDQIQLDGHGVDEDMVWLLARKEIQPALRGHLATESNMLENSRELSSKAFPDGGYFVMRGGKGKNANYLAFDCGPFGYKPVPIHGHADALSIEVYANGRTMVTDCGVYSYHLGEDWRRYFRGTRAHNTIAVDGRDQSVLLDEGRVYRMANATLHEWVTNSVFDFVDGSHDGYQRLEHPVRHRRKVFFIKPEYWIIVDLLTGQPNNHVLEQYFHLMPWASPMIDPQTSITQVSDNGQPLITFIPVNKQGLRAEIINGQEDPIQGWVSFYSGEKVAAPVLKYSKNAQLPTSFVTVIHPHAANSHSLCVKSQQVSTREGHLISDHRVTALTVETEEHVDACLIAHPKAPTWKVFADYETDGGLIFVRHCKRNNTVEKVIMHRTSHLLFKGTPLHQRGA